MGDMVERRLDTPDSLYRQRQHRVPLHRVPRYAESRRLVYLARQRTCQRVSELRGRQDLHLAQLGGMAQRVFSGFPGQTGRAALCADRQRTRDERQRLHVGGFSGTQQQRVGSHIRQFCEPCISADRQVFRGEGARCGRTDRLRPADNQ